MSHIKKIFKIIGIVIGVIILILIIDYIRLNIIYLKTKGDYKEVFDIHGNSGKYTPQGLTYSDKYNVVLQTSYNSKHTVSMLYVIDFKTGKLIKELKLKEIDDSDNVNHAGGITTDNKTVWITNDNEVNEYSLEEIINTNNDYIKSMKNSKLPNIGDFCTYNKNILWIGDYMLKPLYNVPNDNPLLMGYDLNNELDYNKPDYIVSLPIMVQGLVITEDNKFIFSRSFSNLIQSDLTVYDNVLKTNSKTYTLNRRKIPYYKFTNDIKLNNRKIPPMSENMFLKDNEIYLLFENSSDTYFYALPKIKKVVKLDINKIVKK